jgi:glycosidase
MRQTCFILSPDRFANGNQNDSDATKENTIDLPGGRHGDIQGIIKLRLHLLSWSNSDLEHTAM